MSWKWVSILTGSAGLAWLSCCKIESPVVFWNFTLKFFVYALLGWAVCSVLYKVYQQYTSKTRRQSPLPEGNNEQDEFYRERMQRRTESMQIASDEKVESYKERILKPREEARRQKQEQELNLVMGHTFRGHGQFMGSGDEIRHCTSTTENVSEDARLHRRLPPDVKLHNPRPEPSPDSLKKQRVIQLPKEPPVDCADAVTVTLHTPLNQRKSRRFLNTSTLQVVLDYMTTLGFSQTYNTLSSSYPRQVLTQHAGKTLKELQFGKRTLLYIEDKED